MGNVIIDMSVSLDGFIAGPNDEDAGLHHWFFSPSDTTAKVIEESIKTTGVIIMGRRTYDIAAEQDGFVNNPYPVPHVILSRTVPEKLAEGAETFIFVTDGLEHAVQQAHTMISNKNIVVGGGAYTAQQLLKSGLVDEIHLHLVPLLLGHGKRLFEHLDISPIELQSLGVIETPDVTHLRFRVIK